jgi:tetratricopeptide (TPR) repeat protein
VEAFTVTLSGNVPGAVLVARIGRGRALLRLGRAPEAIPDLVEAVALCTEQGITPADSFARQDLANAYKLAGRPVEAAEVAEEAVIGFGAAGLAGPADDTRYLLAGLYRDLGDTEEAVAGYRELLTRLTENPAGRAQLAEELGDLLFRIDRDGEAAEQFRVAGEALHEIGDLIGELRAVRRRLSAQHYADDVAGAEETIQEIDELWEELPAELAEKPNAIWQRAMTGFDAAQLLMSRDRYAGAVAHLRGGPEKLRAVGATDDANRLECMLGEALLRSGEAAEASALLTDLLARTPGDWPLREAAERMKAEAQGA